jgi:hypothetical protein
LFLIFNTTIGINYENANFTYCRRFTFVHKFGPGRRPPPHSSLIEGSYTVIFKGPTGKEKPFIDKADLSKKDVKGYVAVAPFGEHSTGQRKEDVEKALGLKGKVNRIYDTMNAVHIFMDAKEAYRLSQDKRVKLVEQNHKMTVATTQNSPGWGLDRLDQPTTALNNQYNYTNTGAGRTIYILDTGLDLTQPNVVAEFGGRAANFYDFNVGGTGADCNGHGSMVASVAGGNTYGTAKGATLQIVKITDNCSGNSNTGDWSASFNWLATNAPHGTIVNLSSALSDSTCNPVFEQGLEDAIANAHDAGIIVVIAAGNDICNTADFSTTSLPHAFVVGATDDTRLALGQDAKAWFSSFGWNVSAFAPGQNVDGINQFGNFVSGSGTSFSAPYIAGIFAVACQAVGAYCNTTPTADMYTALRNTGMLGTVTNSDGTPLTGATSRFISQQW